ncbi:hypothetical protein Psuf_008360 [Phytohabitans suffuscus]|uniref:Uncharacterized protein n=1 Tax=Phytohabitans suffuscus TaxID=624315 RepID=A0A6F8YBX2_9ACTN|nr:hypothetical protein Psuf_008360 [Phytohabitans suffuscus]
MELAVISPLAAALARGIRSVGARRNAADAARVTFSAKLTAGREVKSKNALAAGPRCLRFSRLIRQSLTPPGALSCCRESNSILATKWVAALSLSLAARVWCRVSDRGLKTPRKARENNLICHLRSASQSQ